jgi:hypothetical protein
MSVVIAGMSVWRRSHTRWRPQLLLIRVQLSLIREQLSLIREHVSLIREQLSLIRAHPSLIRAHLSLVRAHLSLIRKHLSLVRERTTFVIARRSEGRRDPSQRWPRLSLIRERLSLIRERTTFVIARRSEGPGAENLAARKATPLCATAKLVARGVAHTAPRAAPAVQGRPDVRPCSCGGRVRSTLAPRRLKAQRERLWLASPIASEAGLPTCGLHGQGWLNRRT